MEKDYDIEYTAGGRDGVRQRWVGPFYNRPAVVGPSRAFVYDSICTHHVSEIVVNST